MRKGLPLHRRLFEAQMTEEQQRGDGSQAGEHTELVSSQPDRKGEDSG